jgi:hypothetical protein
LGQVSKENVTSIQFIISPVSNIIVYNYTYREYIKLNKQEKINIKGVSKMKDNDIRRVFYEFQSRYWKDKDTDITSIEHFSDYLNVKIRGLYVMLHLVHDKMGMCCNYNAFGDIERSALETMNDKINQYFKFKSPKPAPYPPPRRNQTKGSASNDK